MYWPSVYSAKFRRYTAIGWKKDFSLEELTSTRWGLQVGWKSRRSESVATLPPFSPTEGQKWFDQISSQWESQKNRFALTYFGKIQFLPPWIWNLPFMSTASEQNWVAERYLCFIYINTHTYIYKSTYPMFAAWILNFQVTWRKIVSLEPPMKLERLVNEVFFYQNIYFLHTKIVRRRHRRRRW